jgi:hypothetical protein
MAHHEEEHDEEEQPFKANPHFHNLVHVLQDFTSVLDQLQHLQQPSQFEKFVHSPNADNSDHVVHVATACLQDHVEGDDAQEVDHKPRLQISLSNRFTVLNDVEVLVIGSTIKYHDDIDEEARIDNLINHDPGERVDQNEGHSCWSNHAGEYQHQRDEQVPVIETRVLRVPHVLHFVLAEVHSRLFLFQFVLFLLSWAELVTALMLLYQNGIDALNAFFDYVANSVFIII